MFEGMETLDPIFKISMSMRLLLHNFTMNYHLKIIK